MINRRPPKRVQSNDHSRLAYAEVHRDGRATTVVDFLERALAFYAERGIVAPAD